MKRRAIFLAVTVTALGAGLSLAGSGTGNTGSTADECHSAGILATTPDTPVRTTQDCEEITGDDGDEKTTTGVPETTDASEDGGGETPVDEPDGDAPTDGDGTGTPAPGDGTTPTREQTEPVPGAPDLDAFAPNRTVQPGVSRSRSCSSCA
jgi:hypothetical protein